MIVKGSFEDYLYIIIGIVWVAVSIYKGAQKRKQSTSAPSSSDGKPKKNFLDSILEEFAEKNSAIYDEPEPREIEEVSPPQSRFQQSTNHQEGVFSYDDVYEESNVNEYDDVYKEEPPLTSPKTQILQKPKKPTIKRKKKRFDIRKAVIYSEILRPPYL